MDFLLGAILGAIATLVVVAIVLIKYGLFVLALAKIGLIKHTQECLLDEVPKYVLSEAKKIAKEKKFDETIKNKTSGIIDKATESLALLDIKGLFKPRYEHKRQTANNPEMWTSNKTDDTKLDAENPLETKEEETWQTVDCHVDEKPITASEWLEQEHIRQLLANDITLITMAMALNREDVLDELVHRRLLHIDAEYEDSQYGDAATLMHIAAGGGHLVAMNWLKKHGVDIDSRTNKGDMPIHFAAYNGQIEAVRWLLDNGQAGGVNTKGQNGRTPIHQAAAGGKVEMIKYLKNREGAQLYVEDIGNVSPMGAAAMLGQTESIKCLKKLGVDVNAKNSIGRTPVFDAVINGKTSSIECLARLDANMDAQDNDGMTPMFLAAIAGQIESMQCLKKLGANIRAKNNNGMTPMFWAALGGHVASIKCLLDMGIEKKEVNATDDNGATPIFAAASNGQTATIAGLVALGAKVDIKAENGLTPIDVAKMGGHAETVKYLQAARNKATS